MSIYWLTGTAASSAALYYEGAAGLRAIASEAGQQPTPITVPIGVAVFPRDIFVPIRRFAEQQFSTITHWTEFDRGGHFAAMEQPELLVRDVRKFRRSLRI
ncbi:MAG TPA: hypothetical protein VFW65_39750 [Pseudonocardiaceae bacterium]|nr:hypothetical protein [Pseudonocardiaceae bacterium]